MPAGWSLAAVQSWAASDSTYGILGLNERVVDGDDMNVVMLDSISIHDTPDSSETVDSDVGRHCRGTTKFGLGSSRL